MQAEGLSPQWQGLSFRGKALYVARGVGIGTFLGAKAAVARFSCHARRAPCERAVSRCPFLSFRAEVEVVCLSPGL